MTFSRFGDLAKITVKKLCLISFCLPPIGLRLVPAGFGRIVPVIIQDALFGNLSDCIYDFACSDYLYQNSTGSNIEIRIAHIA